eukprot:TRINITY_DN70397_c0_g1_i1.p1 TRINITY_DN70397_c0_g1~~TRINITY_DN70397_c0_g1_i1.p1  ORF type:complete len:281 (-),score=25.97 TRINITY_DN70397_c0_g1_i1:450-1292(-)
MPVIDKKRRNSSSGSQGTSMVEVDVDDFECPVCFEIMLESIFQCAQGHFICKSCVEKIPDPKSCPSCRTAYPGGIPVRSRLAEQIVSNLTVACKHGCEHNAKASEMLLHERNCVRRLVKCPMTDCDEVMALGDLTAHYEKKHYRSFRSGKATFRMAADKFNRIIAFETVVVKHSDDRCFLVKMNFLGLHQSARCDHVSVMYQCAFSHIQQETEAQVSVYDSEDQLIVQSGTSKTESISSRSTEEFDEKISSREALGLHLFSLKQLQNSMSESFNLSISFL